MPPRCNQKNCPTLIPETTSPEQDTRPPGDKKKGKHFRHTAGADYDPTLMSPAPSDTRRSETTTTRGAEAPQRPNPSGEAPTLQSPEAGPKTPPPPNGGRHNTEDQDVRNDKRRAPPLAVLLPAPLAAMFALTSSAPSAPASPLRYSPFSSSRSPSLAGPASAA